MIRQLFLIFHLLMASFAVADCHTVRLIETQMADNIVINQFAKRILERAGYSITPIHADSTKAAYELLSHNQADAYLSTWIPLNKTTIRPYLLTGKVKTLGEILSNTPIGIAGNAAAEAAGLISLRQLKPFAETLNHTIYVGQQDWAFAQQLENMIHNNVYELSVFRIQRVHNFDLDFMLNLADKTGQPMIFFTRQFSFMGYQYAKHFLYDTVDALEQFQAQTSIYSSVRFEFPEDCPKPSQVLQSVNLELFDLPAIFIQAKNNKRLLPTAVNRIYDETK